VAEAVTVVVTRPGAAGRELAANLEAAGQPALWLPAFAFGGAPDPAAARALLAGLAEFDLAVFVSPQAVRATAALLAAPWPPETTIAAVGAGTKAAVLASIDGAGAARVLAPATEDDDPRSSGSEALWPLLQAMRPPARRVLLLRAQAGREWLGTKLQAAGATVTPLAVYSRQPLALSAEARARLDAAGAGGLASVVSSSDAVDALVRMLAPSPGALRALLAGRALASHPRIAERLRAAGFADVTVCAADTAAVLEALRAGPSG
jgi:uroporphyrinogen-III synthase